MASSAPTAAEKLAAQHNENETHQPTIEEVPDEEDLKHPPPSATSGLSEKAAGKQKVSENVARSKGPAPLDETAFPALGSAPKPDMTTKSAWHNKPAGIKSVNGSATNGNSNRPNAQGVNLPGRITESITLLGPHMVPRNELKKPVKDILNDINKKSRAKVTMKEFTKGVTSRDGKLESLPAFLFEAQGPTHSDCHKALKEVAAQLSAKLKISVPVPASVRPHIIGKGGATINAIKQLSGANIQVPKQEVGAGPEDEDTEIQVIVEGDAVTAAVAEREINKIVNERTSTVNQHLRDVPPEFFPFLARAFQGQDGVNVTIPEYRSWTAQPPQESQGGQAAAFAPQPNHSIGISGDRERAQAIRASLDKEIEGLRRNLAVKSTNVDRPRHQFIVGNRGMPHSEFLEETGCTIIFPPEGSNDDDTLYIVGPADQLDRGLERALELSLAPKLTPIHTSKQHRGPGAGEAHAEALSQYLRQRGAFARLEQQHNALIVAPPGQSSIECYTDARQTAREVSEMRQDIINMILSHPPSRMSRIPVNPFYIPHIRQTYAPWIRNDHGVFLALPDELDEEPHLVLVYEAPGAAQQYEIPRGAPQPDEAAQFSKALSEARKIIENLVNGQQEIQSQHVDAPTKFHDKIRRYIDREQQEVPQGQVPIQLLLGNQRPQEHRSRDGILLRGPEDALNQWQAQILEFIEQERRDELERSYTTSCDFPQQYMKNLVGTGGSNIKRLREEYDVVINAGEGKVDFKGPQAKAEKAKAEVLAMAQKFKDETTHELTIPAAYHRDLIGAKGSTVNRLQDRYNVRINFPRNKTSADDDVDDAATDAGKQRSQQGPDKVIVRGPRTGADKAKQELEDLYKYAKENNNTTTVSIAQSQVGALMGSGGRDMDRLRQETGASIDVPNASEGSDAQGRILITVKGTKAQIDAAKKLLEARATVLNNTVSKTISVDKQFHKALIGSGGSNIRDIVVKAGGSGENARAVRFPPQDSNDTNIRIEGKKEVVDAIIAEIESIVGARANQVTETLEVQPNKHAMLIGRAGETRRSIEAQFGVTLDIPKQHVTGPARSQVKITGNPGNIEKAKAHITELVKEQQGETIQVPHHLHHAIGDNGSFFRQLRNEHKVRVDHAGQQPPARPAAATTGRSAAGGNLPLITDDPESSDLSFSWSLIEPAAIPESAETIPWVLSGNAENVARAKQLIEKRLASASKPSYTGHLVLPDPRTYGAIVGPGGSRINNLRKQTGTQIQVPKAGARDEAVQIIGSKEGCEQCRDLILELVKNQGPRRGE